MSSLPRKALPFLLLLIIGLPGQMCGQWLTNGSNVYYNGGNVGIGTNTPYNVQNWDKVLDVQGTGNSKIMATSSSSSYRVGLYSHSTWNGGAGFLGTESNHNLFFITNYNPRMVLTTNGDVGIGTVTPQWKLDVDGIISAKGQGFVNVLTNEINLGDIASGDGLRDKLHLCTRDTKRMTLDENGNVGIGTTTPGSFRLAVEGKIGAREVNVTTTAWSDYVFNADYKLRPLAEVQQYIEENRHLPEVPSEKEVLANGQNLGEMNAILLKKIEELTLYVMQLNKSLESAHSKIKELEQEKKN